MTTTSEAAPLPTLSKNQFVALMAMLMSINAISIDIMLPGLQEIGSSLGVTDENTRQLVISTYMIGMGFAQLIFGPLSDRFGRRTPLLAGLALYCACALAIVFVPSFGMMLALRFMQGVGASASRVITVSIVRDVYGGRMMAEIMSLVMMVFMVIPVIAPSIGQLIMLFGEWHLIFVFIFLFGLLVASLFFLHVPETLDPENRRPFTLRSIGTAFAIVLGNRVSFLYALAIAFIFGGLFGFINSAQQLLVGVYGLGVYFPLTFAGFAGLMAVSSFTNSRLVQRFGMRRLSHAALIGFCLVSAAWALFSFLGYVPFWLFAVFYALAMFQFGLIGPNFNAMAMEPLGHVAGTASSVLGFTQTVIGGVLGALIGQAFDGTGTPLAFSFLIVGLAGLVMVLIAERGKLMQPHQNKA
ncbi:MFS transporter [Xaviernesmea oryzae]|uniref:Bcr/CflA family efflux transporter n=1 Tax=Xaviernesmea oryzae TaxID=464029 RepID=A0A1Q9AWS9_9HYPH|nr:multidrug effflux MFS transporter [Xaviernesmea oryzae]OLP59912.1 MFS transporter [Xaviernesmea oryzae]SEK45594.1 MFS transporter, DHA1 family, bicyclomycin/chloramphenicol resistance protein [Xaviernesmea oryzae]